MKKFSQEWESIKSLVREFSQIKSIGFRMRDQETIRKIIEISKISVQIETSSIFMLYSNLPNGLTEEDFWSFPLEWIQSSSNSAEAAGAFSNVIIESKKHDFLIEGVARYCMDFMIWTYHNNFVFRYDAAGAYAKIRSCRMFYFSNNQENCFGLMHRTYNEILNYDEKNYQEALVSINNFSEFFKTVFIETEGQPLGGLAKNFLELIGH